MRLTDILKRLTPASSALGIAGLVLLLGATPAPALAGGKDRGHGHKHGHYKHGHYKHDRGQKHGHYKHRYRDHGYGGHFSIPARIHLEKHHRAYRDYYHGRSYYRPHRHHHVVYHFPVYTEFGVVYRPHSYCDGHLYRGYISYDGPRFSLDVRY